METYSLDKGIYLKGFTEFETLYSFCGPMDQSALGNAVEAIIALFERDEFGTTFRTRAIRLTVEVLQNLFHHADPQENQSAATRYPVFFIVGRDHNRRIHVRSCNVVTLSQRKNLEERFSLLEGLNEEEINALYKMNLSNRQFTPHGGGGMGLYDIARSSRVPIKAEFHAIPGSDLFLYSLTACVRDVCMRAAYE